MKMNTHPVKPRAVTLIALALPLLASAQIMLTNNDASGVSSFNAKGNWNTNSAPAGGFTYDTGSWVLRSPTAVATHTFAGDSLTLSTPGIAGYTFGYKINGSGTLNANWILNGGIVMHNNSSTHVGTFGGTMVVGAAGGTLDAKQGPFIISAPLSGSGTLTVAASSGNQTYSTVTFTGNNSAFDGKMILGNTFANPSVIFNGPNAAPGNPSVATPDQITLRNTLRDDYGVGFTNANGSITLSGNATINANGSNGPTVISVPITDNGNGFNLIKRGGGTLTLSGDNTFSGGLSLYGITVGGRLNINSATALGTGTFTVSNGDNGVIDNTTGSPLTLANNNAQTWGNNFAFVGSNDLDMGSGNVTINGNRTITVSNSTLTVGAVYDDGGARSLTKAGPGTLEINGGASYTGNTVVNGGVLALIGSGSLAFSPTLTVATNATLDMSGVGGMTLASGQTLSGSGTVMGSVTAGSATTIIPGTSIGTLTFANDLVLSGGALTFELSTDTTPGGGTNDLIVVAGPLTVSGATTIQVGGTPALGTYTLFQYGTLAPGSGANLSALGYTIQDNPTAKTIELVVSHVPVSIVWQGDGSGNAWDVATTPNWTNAAGTAVQFFPGDTVTFDDTGAASPPIALSGTIAPTATTVNSSQNYTFTGSGISSGNLTKSGTGTLILENTNTYTGPTVINGGTLQVGNGVGGTLGSGPITNNSALTFNLSANDVTITSPIYGSGSIADNGGATVTLSGSFGGSTVTMAGSGGLALAASNSYSGLTTVSGGTLYARDANALGAAAAGTIIRAGATLYIDRNVDFTNEAFTLSGTLQKGYAGPTTIGGTVTLGADSFPTINVDGGATLTFSNALNVASGNASLTFAGSGNGNLMGPFSLNAGSLTVSGGIWTVPANNNYTGKTFLNGGRLAIADQTSLGPTPGAATPDFVSLGGGVLIVTNDQTYSGGLRGLTVNTGTLEIRGNATLTISGDLNGGGSTSLTKWGSGTLVLAGANSFDGTLYLDGSSNSADDGVTRLVSPTALANVPVTPGAATIIQRNNNSGSSTLQLDGSAGSITLAQEFAVNCRNNTNPNIQNLAGNNILSGNINLNVGGGNVDFQSDAGLLIFSGTNQYVGDATAGRTYNFTGAGDHLVSGPILNGANGAPISVAKSGAGTLTLSADNAYANTTTINAGLLSVTGSISSTGGVYVVGGTLGGTGTINDNVTVQPGGTLAPGSSVGTLTLNGALVLAGNLSVEVNKALTPNSDQVVVSGALNTGSGNRVTVRNLGSTLAVGDTFKLFSGSLGLGNTMTVVGEGVVWNNKLDVDGTISVASLTIPHPVINSIAVVGTDLVFSGTNGYAGGAFDIVSSADVAAPLSRWTVETAGTFDGSGNFSVSIPIATSVPQKFYRVLLP